VLAGVYVAIAVVDVFNVNGKGGGKCQQNKQGGLSNHMRSIITK
jgi:hypothetical protein